MCLESQSVVLISESLFLGLHYLLIDLAELQLILLQGSANFFDDFRLLHLGHIEFKQSIPITLESTQRNSTYL